MRKTFAKLKFFQAQHTITVKKISCKSLILKERDEKYLNTFTVAVNIKKFFFSEGEI
jgi:hypothetical protein